MHVPTQLYRFSYLGGLSLAVLGATLVALTPTDAYGCSCKRQGKWKQVSAAAPFIVRGKFVRHERNEQGGLAHFAVSKVIKGEVSSRSIRIAGSRGKDCSRPTGSLTLGFEFLLALDKDPDSGPQSMSTCVENIIAATAADGVLPNGWPWALLRIPGKALLELEGGPKPKKERLEALAVREWRGFFAERPTVWLFVFKFRNQAAALKAQPELTRQWSLPDGGPFHGDSVVNGAYLLVAGFPSGKPPSREMRAARDAFVQAFAGEE